MAELSAYLNKQNTVEQFVRFAAKNGLRRRNLMIRKSHKLLERFINSRIIYNMLDEEDWVEYLNQDDPAISKTLKVFREGKAFPTPPAGKAGKATALGRTPWSGYATHGFNKPAGHA